MATQAIPAELVTCPGLLGQGPAMQDLFRQVRRAAPHLRTAFVLGESGSGKLSIARALHELRPPPAGPFVVFDALDLEGHPGAEHELYESFFGRSMSDGGHDAGVTASTSGGTLYVDEVAGMPIWLQSRLLRWLEQSQQSRGPAAESTRAGNRVVIAGTSRDPQTEILAGRLRRELVYALHTAVFKIPPLRDRREDILPLAALFIREYAVRMGESVTGLTDAAKTLLLKHTWPGNVRELRDVIEGACFLADGEQITGAELKRALNP